MVEIRFDELDNASKPVFMVSKNKIFEYSVMSNGETVKGVVNRRIVKEGLLFLQTDPIIWNLLKGFDPKSDYKPSFGIDSFSHYLGTEDNLDEKLSIARGEVVLFCCRSVLTTISDALWDGRDPFEMLALRRGDKIFIGINADKRSLHQKADPKNYERSYWGLNFAHMASEPFSEDPNNHDPGFFKPNNAQPSVVREVRLANDRPRETYRLFVSSSVRAYNSFGDNVEFHTAFDGIAGMKNADSRCFGWWLRAFISGAKCILVGNRNYTQITEVNEVPTSDLLKRDWKSDQNDTFRLFILILRAVKSILNKDGKACKVV